MYEKERKYKKMHEVKAMFVEELNGADTEKIIKLAFECGLHKEKEFGEFVKILTKLVDMPLHDVKYVLIPYNELVVIGDKVVRVNGSNECGILEDIANQYKEGMATYKEFRPEYVRYTERALNSNTFYCDKDVAFVKR